MTESTLVVCGALLIPRPEIGRIEVVRDRVLRIQGGVFREVLFQEDADRLAKNANVIDASKSLVTPGLIDCHTHAMFAGGRPDEYFERLGGVSYEGIARRGGGIQKTVRQTREANDETLLALARARLDRFLSFGVTTVEVKSGYGLSLEEELRLLRLIGRLDHRVSTLPTFLGAHTLPSEYEARREAYVEWVREEMLSAVAESKLSAVCDVFCDPIAFSVEESRSILAKAKSLGFAVKLHADQLSDSGGAALAAEIGAVSADHLDFTNHLAMDALARSNTIGVMIPTSSLFLGKRHQPAARAMIERGMRLAISTDCNPGTSHTQNLPLSMALAATELRMTLDEIWLGVTSHAAMALGLVDRGGIAPGQRADLAVWDTLDPRDIPYAFGSAVPSKSVTQGIPTS